jgi:hypothetical protein
MVVNTKQKIAVLAAGLAVATTGLVTDHAVAEPPAPVVATQGHAQAVAPGQPNREIGGER